MADAKRDKTGRVLDIYTKLMNGATVNKAQLADYYGVAEKSVQRDFEDISAFLENSADTLGEVDKIVYDHIAKGYHLERVYKEKFTNAEILALCKILLDSRAFTKNEMSDMIKKLIECCVPGKNQKLIKNLISNEAYHYVEPCHKTVFMDKMWDIGQAIAGYQYIEIDYLRNKDKTVVKRKLKPVAIMFSEYYFYIAAFMDEGGAAKSEEVVHKEAYSDLSPTIYRIDRIKKLRILDEKFHIPYSSRFEEGEFRKRIQFMYGGKLKKVKFKYSGMNVESVLDRLPTAVILDEENGVYTISAEVFGSEGLDMWLRSQGDNVVILS